MEGIPILPLPIFEVPVEFKLELLLGEINFCTVLDLNSSCDILKEHGLDCLVKKEGDTVQINVTSPSGESLVLDYGIIGRLLYECLSVQTVLDYTMDVLKFASKMKD